MNQATTLSPPIFSPNFSTSNDAMDDLNNRWDRILDKCFDRIFERMEKMLAERSNAALSQASTVDELAVGCDNSVSRVPATTTTEIPSTTTINQATTLSPPIFSPNFSTSNDAMDDLNNRLDRILDKCFDRIFERMEKRLAERSNAALSQASTVDDLAVGCDNSVGRVPATTTTESTELLDASSERVSLVASEADHGIDAGGLAAPTPTTCSTECQSRDTTASTSAFTLDTTRASAAAIVDVVHVLAAPAASDGTLDGDTISGATSTPTTCSTGGTVRDDPGTVFLIPRSVAASPPPPPPSEISHPKHPEHKLTLVPTGPAKFKCNGCLEQGTGGDRYTCEPCGFVLHKDCALAQPTLVHPLLPESTFELCFEAPRSKDQRRLCDACGTPVQGIHYHCVGKKLDLHPCCAKLPMEIKLSDELKFELREEVSHCCTKCGKGGGVRDYWFYRSTSNSKKVYLHVGCAKEDLLLPSSSTESDVVDDNGRLARFVNETAFRKHGSGKAGRNFGAICEIVKALASIILSVITGNPLPAIAAGIDLCSNLTKLKIK